MNVVAQTSAPISFAPLSLQDAPSFIERQFPVGRLSAEAYKERDAGQGQTLTALGSFWKGRKPLILVRAVVLGCLLPATEDPAADLDIFLKLMAMDDAASRDASTAVRPSSPSCFRLTRNSSLRKKAAGAFGETK
jgi:putative DNA methylase